MGTPVEISQKIIMNKLQQLPENEVTKKFIIPLLESLGFTKVEFYGGVNENGKDILCWSLDRMDDIILTVAQVKHFKFTSRARGSNSLQTIINQLINCFSNPLPYINKSTHLPSEAILISTYEIETKTLQSRFGNQAGLWEQRIKIIDGPKLINLLVKKRPDLINELLGFDIELSSKIYQTLNNETLLKALGYQDKKDLKAIYTDIDFSIGKVTTELFFKKTFVPRQIRVSLKSIDWNNFKANLLVVNNLITEQYLNKTINQIEAEFKPKNDLHLKWKRELSKLEEEFKIKNAELDISLQEFSQKKKELANKINEFKKLNSPKHIRITDSDKKVLQGKVLTINKEFNPIISELLEVFKRKEDEVNELKRVIDKHKLAEKVPTYDFEINGSVISDILEKTREWIEGEIENFNTGRKELAEISDFIIKCKEVLDSASIIFLDKLLLSSVLTVDTSRYRGTLENTRLKIPIDKIFDTGINVAVLGEAGAGKTTCLQMYALSKQNDTSKFHIWLPLSRVIHDWLKIDPNLADSSIDHNLSIGIVNYLSNVGISITYKDFSIMLQKHKTVLMLDGIDEAIKVTPWLLNEIKKIAHLYNNNLQVIVSSRMSGTYLNEIPFFTITLLPFTNEQRDSFIEKWFGPDRIEFILRIKEHLKKSSSIREIVKNPLLTTTLCVLAENNVPLPTTEIKLYFERFNLLTGYYDNVKNIARRISSTPQNLKQLSIKLAFHLHSNGKREEDYYTLQNQAIQLMLNKLSVDNSTTALKELIDPCNILVPMTEDGKFGFGHLRYQEYLAAEYILINRGIDVLTLLKQPWWRGAIILFAQMNDSIRWLINEVGNHNEMADNKHILRDIINSRPKIERSSLFSLMDKYLDLDTIDHLGDNIYETD